MDTKTKANSRVGLLRRLGLWGGVEMGIAAMIGGSIYTLTGFGAQLTGPSLPLAMLLTAILAGLPTVLVYAELASSRPETGGGYLWVREGLGPVHGHFFGWFSWCAHSVACGVYALSFGFYLSTFLDTLLLPIFGLSLPGAQGAWEAFFAVVLVIALSTVNYRGVKTTERFGRVVILFAIGAILPFIVLGFWSYLRGGGEEHAIRELSSLPFGVGGLLGAMGLMFLGFQGFEVVAQTAEEIRRPRRTIPRALLISFFIMVVIYMFSTTAAIIGVKGNGEGWKVLADAGQGALVRAAMHFPWGGVLVWVVATGGAIVGAAALNATIFSASHVFYAMARKGRSLPIILEALHPRYGTPIIGILATALLTTLLVLIFPIKEIAATVDLLFFFLFGQVHLAYIQFRRKYPELPRRFKAPFYPWLSLGCLAVLAILALQVIRITPWSLSFFLAWLIFGMLIHRIYVERQESGEFGRGKVIENSESKGPGTSSLMLFPVAYQTSWWRDVLPFVAALAKQNKGEIFALCLLEQPERGENRWLRASDKQGILAFHKEVSEALSKLDVTYTVRSQLTTNGFDTVLLAVQKLDADLLIIPYQYLPPQQRVRGRAAWARGLPSRDFRQILRDSRCNLILFTPVSYRQPRRLLVGVTESTHNRFLGNVAGALAAEFYAAVTLVHVASKERREEWTEFLEHLRLPAGGTVEKRWVVRGDAAGEILKASEDHDVVILGAGEISLFESIGLGATAELIANRSDKPVFICYQHMEIPLLATRLVDRVIEKVAHLGFAKGASSISREAPEGRGLGGELRP